MYLMAEGKFVALYRVSTGKQQRSGLGLEAERGSDKLPKRRRLETGRRI